MSHFAFVWFSLPTFSSLLCLFPGGRGWPTCRGTTPLTCGSYGLIRSAALKERLIWPTGHQIDVGPLGVTLGSTFVENILKVWALACMIFTCHTFVLIILFFAVLASLIHLGIVPPHFLSAVLFCYFFKKKKKTTFLYAPVSGFSLLKRTHTSTDGFALLSSLNELVLSLKLELLLYSRFR